METTIDCIIEDLPLSFFHHKLLIICGLSFMADSMEVALLSFLSTCAGDEFHLSDGARASLVGVVFAGELLGSLFWGPFADKYGRKIAFLLASVMISLFGFLSAISPNFICLLIFRTLVGFGVGGGAVPFDLLAEFLPGSHRGSYLMSIEYAWTFGSLFVVGVAWASLTSAGWRQLTFITAVPVTLASIACFIFLPESPRWLMIKGRISEAEDIMKKAAATCGVTLEPFILILDSQKSNSTSVEEYEYYDLIKTKKARSISLPLWTIWLIFGFTYYGIILFVSKLYSTKSATNDDSNQCFFDYQSIFLNSFAEIIGVFISCLVIDKWGRINTQLVFFIIGGIALMVIGGELSFSFLLIIGIIARLSIMGASVSI